MNDDVFFHALKQEGFLSEDHLLVLKEEQKHQNKSLQQLAVDLRFIEKDTILKIASNLNDIPYICLKNNFFDSPKNISVYSLGGYIFNEDLDSFFIALEDPLDILLKDKIKSILGNHKSYQWYCGNLDYVHLSQNKNESYPNKDCVEDILYQAVHSNASDIHICPSEKTTNLYFRINGILALQKTWHKNFLSTMINRFKILSELDIAQTRISQSGSFSMKVDPWIIHFRVSIHPTIEGERVAIRILNQHKIRPDFKTLGFSTEDQHVIEQSMDKKQGLILLTGATGSGKTTTLYACLDLKKDKNMNIMTLEDPVEYILPYATQTEITSSFSYSDGIRSLLRQDPDVILIGEIRDQETALMAFRAAMTGHLVLSTLHTQSIETIPYRLMDLGLSEHIVQTFLLMGICQRLIPIEHDECLGKGCSSCKKTGVIGRKLDYSLKKFF